MFKTRWLLALILVIPNLAFAGLRHYAADVPSSSWKLSEQSRLQCTLSHPIPGYGNALFTSMASKQLNMEFELDMLRLPKTYGVAAVYSVPPAWMPGEGQREIADMSLRKQFNGDLPEQAAWTMLSELEKGFWPTVYYADWYNPYDKVAVGLNASNFAPTYEAFVNCVANLLPFNFDDIAYTVLSYQKNSTELTKYSQKRLNMIGEYLKEDTDMELVLLDGYSDSYGGRWNNLQLSIRRAEAIQNYFEQMGVDPERIEVTGHGERRHVAGNSHAMDRAKNRRVVVRLAKP
ncbi:OmpA family protein [Aestuariibacter halophilus]|uniref:OmpA family protein n=1 Tax=Fluctibacter halophilus TaxID=226011 RepID=A0ABS8GAN8_9ALTE|nr:OmpA family protein [Aestuariibacter halophilus]MCC2616779.1 OmpA family protein [Aestuariibacter halophilus]